MNKQTSTGTCSLCGKHFSRASMTRHLKACGLPDLKSPVATAPAREPSSRSFHLFVEARYNKAYWLHLAVPAEARLDRVDAFLRDIWLECCGHLSGFAIAGERYASDAGEDPGWSGMKVRLGRILEPGMVFSYEYDYGSTTELSLKVVGLRDQGTHRGAVELLARNDAPQVSCERCGKHPATWICTECAYVDQGWLCQGCAEDHGCGTEMCLPVVNSPRAGVCGYTGPNSP
jgi:Plasmid pRiA4b ORF-3-like protein